VIRNPIAAQTLCLRQTFTKALHTAAKMGCEGVQIDARKELRPAEISETGLRQLRKMLADLNLQVASIALPTRRGFSDPSDLDRRLQATMAAMRFASQLGSRILVGNLGSLPSVESTSERTALIEAITCLATYGERWGVALAVDCGGADLESVVELIDTLPEGTLGLDLNPARQIAHGNLPATFIEQAGRHIRHVYATDGVRDLSGGQPIAVQLGRGTADFPELLGRLEEHSYRGWLTIAPNESKYPLEELSDAVQYLRAL